MTGNLDLPALAALLEAATPGPWAHTMPKSGWITAEHPVIGMFHVADIRGWGDLTGKGHGALGLSISDATAVQTANAALIALAPTLAATVLRLTAERDALKENVCGMISAAEAISLTGPNGDGEYWIHVKTDVGAAGFNLGTRRGVAVQSIEVAFSDLMAAVSAMKRIMK